jgi:hypothetical protein
MRLRELVTEVLINPISRTRTGHFRRAYPPKRDNIKLYMMIDHIQYVLQRMYGMLFINRQLQKRRLRESLSLVAHTAK